MISEKYRPTHRRYRFINKRKELVIAVIAIAMVAVMVLSVAIGQYKITFTRTFQVIIDCIMGNEVNRIDRVVIWNLKVPRAFMGLVVGASLGVAGACMQSTLRNPLADPFTTGISSGASFGATIMILYGTSVVGGISYDASLAVNAFLFALVPIAVICFFSVFRKLSPTMSIMIGISVMFIFSSTTSLMKLMADPNDLQEVYNWSVGTLGKATWDNLKIVAPVSAVIMAVLYTQARKLNILSTGDRYSRTLGLNPGRMQLTILILVALMTAISVCFTGPIGFIGLIAPHVCRMLFGSDCRYLIPASAVTGALITLVADCISESISEVYLPVGSVVALFGGPFFLYLLLRSNGRSWN